MADSPVNIPEGVRRVYPFESHWLETPGGHRLHFLDEGRGEPVVMVHGNPTWSFYYRNLVRELSLSMRCVVPDHIGSGLSDKPPTGSYPYTLSRRVEDLELLLDTLGVTENITLIVHDWGGAIGLMYATRHPERVRRIVVLNTAAFLPPGGKGLPLRLKLARNTGRLASPLVRGLNAFVLGTLLFGAKTRLSPAARRGLALPYDSWKNRVGVLAFVRDIPDGPGHPTYADVKWLDDHLHRLRGLPMLVIWGMKDFVFDADYFDEFRRRFPEAECHPFPRAGHYILEDAPEETGALVRRFLKAHPVP